jgi:hypothetical protein
MLQSCLMTFMKMAQSQFARHNPKIEYTDGIQEELARGPSALAVRTSNQAESSSRVVGPTESSSIVVGSIKEPPSNSDVVSDDEGAEAADGKSPRGADDGSACTSSIFRAVLDRDDKRKDLAAERRREAAEKRRETDAKDIADAEAKKRPAKELAGESAPPKRKKGEASPKVKKMKGPSKKAPPVPMPSLGCSKCRYLKNGCGCCRERRKKALALLGRK